MRVPKKSSEKLIQQLLDEDNGQPRPGDQNPDSVWKLRALARCYSLEMIEIVAGLARGSDNKIKLAAASLLLDRGWGKPAQQIEVGQPGDFTELSDDELDEVIMATREEIIRKDKTNHH